eukprot:1922269-Pyramimonas_sp.AAC.1
MWRLGRDSDRIAIPSPSLNPPSSLLRSPCAHRGSSTSQRVIPYTRGPRRRASAKCAVDPCSK